MPPDPRPPLLSAPSAQAGGVFAADIGIPRVDFPAGKWDPFPNVNTSDNPAEARRLAPQAKEGQP